MNHWPHRVIFDVANVSDVVFDASNVLRSSKSKMDFEEDDPYSYDQEESRTSSLGDVDKEDQRLLGDDLEADSASVKSRDGNAIKIRQRSSAKTGSKSSNKNTTNSTPSALESQLNDDEAL